MKLLSSLFVFTTFLALCSFSYFNGDFPSVNLKTLDGNSVNIQDQIGQGKTTVVSFWATWCSPCKRELDNVSELYEDWQADYDAEVIAITIDDARGFAKVPGMVASKGWEFPILADTKQELMQALNFQSIPQTFILDAEGKIVYTHNGYNPGDELEIEDKLAELAGK